MTQAFGAWSRMASAISTNMGIVRMARMKPPAPTVSPTGCHTPRRSGRCTSERISSKVPGSMEITTKSAPSSAPASVSLTS